MIEEVVHALRIINTFVIVSALVPLGLFVYRYLRYSNWKATDIGRTLLYQKFAFIAVILLALSAYILPPHNLYRILAGTIVYVSLVGLFWRTLVNLLIVQKRHPQEKREIKNVR